MKQEGELRVVVSASVPVDTALWVSAQATLAKLSRSAFLKKIIDAAKTKSDRALSQTKPTKKLRPERPRHG